MKRVLIDHMRQQWRHWNASVPEIDPEAAVTLGDAEKYMPSR